jgi:hypothetical protein
MAAIVSSLDKLNRPGDIVIEDIILTTPAGGVLSIWNLLMSVEIYEDMYSNSLSGSLVFSDGLAISNHLPIVGSEMLKIVFYTPGQENQSHKKIELNMRVYKVHRANVTDKAALTVLDFVSEEFFLNSMVKFSASYKNMPYSKMAENIFQDHIATPIARNRENLTASTNFAENSNPSKQDSYNVSFITVGTEGQNKSVVFPYWSPFYAINWLANKSYTTISPPNSGSKGDRWYADKKAADYLFFQQLNGNYVFAPASYFKAQSTVAKYRQVPADKQNDALMFDNIEDVTLVSLNNKLQDVATGVYGSILNTIDIHKKKIGGDYYRYREKFFETQHTDEYPLVSPRLDGFSDNILSYIKVLPKNSYKFDGIEDNEEHERYALLRQSQMNQMNCVTLTIKVMGDSRRRVGDMIYVELPSPESLNTTGKGLNNDGNDKYLTGNYLITKINHSFTHNDYELIMTISKDSYRASTPDQKVQDNTVDRPVRESRV